MKKEEKEKRFIEKAEKKYNYKYDYSKVDYVDTTIPVCIICPEHGEFWQKPSEHLSNKYGCPECAKGLKTNGKKLTTEDFIEKAKLIYGNKYDYSNVNYSTIDKPVCIICPEHGEFWQKPYNHLKSKHGCPICGRESTSNANKLTTEKFIDKVKKIHGGKYNYSKTEYKDYYTKVCIICPEHGEFYQTPDSHLHGAGCQKCGETPPLTTEEFILKARQIHGWKYDYSKVEYVNNHTPICIICPEHGEFYQTPISHIHNYGCSKCSKEKKIEIYKVKFIQKARQVHGWKYDYSKVEYVNSHTPVCIICPKHGEFYQKPSNHIEGHSCPICGGIFTEKKYTYDYCYNVACKYKTFYEFRKYDYRTYVNAKESGWIKDYTWIEEVQYEDMKSQTIYVYEFPDNSAYVGLTNNIKRRDLQHRTKKYRSNGQLKNDTVLDYSIEHDIEIPQPKILKEHLTRKESQIEEKRYIELYRKNGWNVLNKVKGGSLGAIFVKEKWTKEDIIQEAKKYKNQEEMRKYSRTWYNRMIHAKLTKECFPNGRFLDSTNMKNQYEYTEKFLMEMKQKYPLKQDLRKNEHRVYTWLWKHDRLNEFYPETSCYPNGKEKRLYTEDFLMEIKQKYPNITDLKLNDKKTYDWLYKHDKLNEFYP